MEEEKLPMYLQQFSADTKAEISETHRQVLMAEQKLRELRDEFVKFLEDKIKGLGHDVSEVVLDISNLTLSRKGETK